MEVTYRCYDCGNMVIESLMLGLENIPGFVTRDLCYSCNEVRKKNGDNFSKPVPSEKYLNAEKMLSDFYKVSRSRGKHVWFY